uniref:NACHT domain-containing protein n=1 Tax=Erpetoichthys calabaricus TaxID=27687 RepID=A0A8C4STD3_ERPCA
CSCLPRTRLPEGDAGQCPVTFCWSSHQRATVSESTIALKDQASSAVPHSTAEYTELMVIKQNTRTIKETEHELEKTGRTHEELKNKETKKKCERIWTEQIFKRSPGSETSPHIVLVSGVAGIGKTTMIQKIVFDWSGGTQYQRFAFVFLFKFRELNLLDNEIEPRMSLTRLIERHYKHLSDSRLTEILQKPESLLLIFDGLDEYKHKLIFTDSQLCSNPDVEVPVYILVTSLLSRTLLKGCSVLITSRPTALKAMDMERVDRLVEILGFLPEQRLTYFKNFFSDAALGCKAFQYVEEIGILYSMCFNPSYCRMICSVLKSHFMTSEKEQGAAPRTVTEIFVMFLHNILTNYREEAKYQRKILVRLGKMAYNGVDKNIFVFYNNLEMSTFGLQPVVSSSFLSGFLESQSTPDHSMYTFHQVTLQEFMAACSFYFDPSGDVEELLKYLNLCKDGRFEIVTRFLAGLAWCPVLKALEGILGEFEGMATQRIQDWVRQKAKQALQGQDKREAVRVCHWLCETQNKELIRDAIGKDLKMNFSNMTLSSVDCAVLASVISCCGELKELDLSETPLTPECIRRLAPGFSCCYVVSLVSCRLTSTCCSALSSALSAPNSQLTELSLNENNMEDSGVEQLCEGLRTPYLIRTAVVSGSKCISVKTAQSLSPCAVCPSVCLSLLISLGLHRLWSCGLTSACCSALSSILSSPNSRLTELDLYNSNLGDSGAHQLSEGLRIKRGRGGGSCHLTARCCSALSSVLSSPNSRLTLLVLNNNKLGDSGAHQLSEGLRSDNCKLEKLW